MTPAEQKEAEANVGGLKEVKSDVSSNSSSEDIPPFQKRSRRKECIFITVAVILGAGLIAVLVYFSVTNALKDDEPVARESQGEEPTSTTPDYDNYYDYQSGNDQSGVQTKNRLSPGTMTRNGLLTRSQGDSQSPGSNLRSALRNGPEQIGGQDLPSTSDSGSGAPQQMGPSSRTMRGGPVVDEEQSSGGLPQRRRMLPSPPDAEANDENNNQNQNDGSEDNSAASDTTGVSSVDKTSLLRGMPTRRISPEPTDENNNEKDEAKEDKEDGTEENSAVSDEPVATSVDKTSLLRRMPARRISPEPTGENTNEKDEAKEDKEDGTEENSATSEETVASPVGGQAN